MSSALHRLSTVELSFFFFMGFCAYIAFFSLFVNRTWGNGNYGHAFPQGVEIMGRGRFKYYWDVI